jgi:hypothetical protein
MQKNWVPIDKRTTAVLKAKGFTIIRPIGLEPAAT